jgi:aspartyl-tRNA(Asn)/glutamyl-tRNA(Gln) amidotransferase subunit C
MPLSNDQLRHVAHLARLRIEQPRLDGLGGELDAILAMVDALRAADTRDVTPMAHPLDMAQRGREDLVTEEDQRDRFQALAPEAVDGLYRVPRVIE